MYIWKDICVCIKKVEFNNNSYHDYHGSLWSLRFVQDAIYSFAPLSWARKNQIRVILRYLWWCYIKYWTNEKSIFVDGHEKDECLWFGIFSKPPTKKAMIFFISILFYFLFFVLFVLHRSNGLLGNSFLRFDNLVGVTRIVN